jgi:hypothetical protein
MNKLIDFQLNEFQQIPAQLRQRPEINLPSGNFTIDLCRLYHHYYLDSYKPAPPDPNHANFEYLRFLAPTDDFRFLSDGPWTNSGKKRRISTELGQAFCRYFLYEFLGITYFAHMDKVLNRTTHPAFNGLKVKRIRPGDVPDYLCAKSVNRPYIAEAKGRFSNINFNSAAFDEWRQQFLRIGVYDRNNIPLNIKGYIIATKFTTEKNRPNIKSKLSAEDPELKGKTNFPENEFGLRNGCIAIHYSRILSKFGLGLLSASLESGFTVPRDLSFQFTSLAMQFWPSCWCEICRRVFF